MKLRKALSSALAATMILGAMTFTAFAEEDIVPEPFVDDSQTAPIMTLSDEESTIWSADISWYDETKTEFSLREAEQLAGFAQLVNEGTTFEDKTIKLAKDIDLTGKYFIAIGNANDDKAFKGTFDGNYYKITGLSQNCWGMGYGATVRGGFGLFGYVEDAAIINLKIDKASVIAQTVIGGTIAGYAYGECLFEDITITNSEVGVYNWYCGGVVGWASGTHAYKNVDLDATNRIGGLWGEHCHMAGGVIGGISSSGTFVMENCDVACVIDAYNDVGSNYMWGAYIATGMLVGEAANYENGKAFPNNLKCINCTVTYDDWNQYTYCEFQEFGQGSYNAPDEFKMRRNQPGIEYGGIDLDHEHEDFESHAVLMPFYQLFGSRERGVYGGETYEGVTIIDLGLKRRAIATVDGELYDDLDKAIEAASATGDGTVKLISNAAQSATVKAPQVTTYATVTGVTIDLNNFKLNGNVLVEEGATAIIKNGAIVNEDSSVSAIQSHGTVTLENVNITSARHAIRIENGIATINGGTYKVNNTDGKTTHAINVGENGYTCTVVINGGTFIGPKGTAADSGTAVNVKAGSIVTINGGYFSGGKNNTLAAKETGKIVVNAGLFDQDPSAYVADGFVAEESVVDGYAYMVAPKTATKINVVFDAKKDAAGKPVPGEYIIKLVSADGYEINEFTSAQLIFKNLSKSLDGEIGTLPYEIIPAANLTVTKGLEGKENYEGDGYAFALNKDPNVKANRITDDEIELGTIKFTSQGTPALKVTYGTVVATKYHTNIPRYYSTDANLNDEGLTLDITAAEFEGSLIPDTTRNVAVNIAYNLGLVGKVWADDEIEVTLVDSFGKEYTATVNEDQTLFAFENVKTGRITVKLSAPGFRTYTYDAILYEGETPLVLNFWNNVKTGEEEDPLAKIDNSNAIEAKMAHNFVVGDIVMDFIVDRYDLAAVTSYYGMYDITGRENAASKYLKYDLNRDGNIDIIDVHYVLHTFGN